MNHDHERVFDMILVIGLIILIIAFIQMNSGNIVMDSNRMSQCLQDSDCTLVNADCCGCNQGGGKTAVNKYYIGYWNSNLSTSCKDISCPAVISTDMSCSSEAKCLEGVCKAITML